MAVSLVLPPLIALLLLATYTDFKALRIPNWLTFGGAIVGLLVNIFSAGFDGLLFSLSGGMVGLLLLIPLYIIGKLGAGDVKLLAMTGMFIGVEGVVWAGLWSAVAGGILALVWVVAKTGLRSAYHELVGTLTMLRFGVNEVLAAPKGSVLKAKMPYALAIAVGSLMSVWQVNQV